MHEHNVRIRFIGYIQGLSEELQTIISDSEALTKNNTGLTLQLAINYGGRDEIVRTVQGIAHSVLGGDNLQFKILLNNMLAVICIRKSLVMSTY